VLIDLLRWWLVVEVLGLLALPLTIWFFRRLPDRGYSLAKAFGLLLTGYGAWLLSMVGLGSFGYLLLSGIALLLLALGIGIWGRGGLRICFAELRQRLGWIGFQEALFLAALYGGILLRQHDFFGRGVAIWHTEQPMDLTFISGILASPQFPPQDPWLAPYAINYYYLGYLLIAALVRLSGVSVGVGYTLGIATIFALTAVMVAGIVRNLIDLSRPQGDLPDWRLRLGRAAFPLLGVVLVLLASNQIGALQVLAGSEKVVALEPLQLARAVGNGLGTRAPIELPPPFPAQEFGGDPRLLPGDKVQDFNAWWPSRAVWDDLRSPEGATQRVYAITEFPFFSFLLGDLHPHVLSLPWSLLAVAVALNVLLRQAAPDFRSRSGTLQLALTGIVIGGLYAINSWDLPTYVLLYLGALTLLYLRLAPTPGAFFWPHFIQQAGATILASYLVYFPFHLTFAAPTQGFPLGIAPARTGLTEFLVIFGLAFVPLLAFVIRSGRAAHVEQANRSIWPLAPLSTALLLLLLLPLGRLLGWPLLALLPLALWAAATAYTCRREPATAFALWLFAVGALVIWGVDLLYLRDSYGSPRMNTIFKFYYQVWLLWGMLAAFALWTLAQRIRWASLGWLLPFLALLAGSLVYPALAPADSRAQEPIDGLAYLRQDQPGEAAAIDWIRRNTSGDAIVLQAPGKPYQSDTARIASATGRPTVIGWTQHENLWRGGQPQAREEISAREQDVVTIYTTSDPQQAQSLLQKYGVDYVYVGPNEQTLATERAAPPEALSKFDGWMQRVFEQDGVIIYGPR
jgi:YYY domain-containing protein